MTNVWVKNSIVRINLNAYYSNITQIIIWFSSRTIYDQNLEWHAKQLNVMGNITIWIFRPFPKPKLGILTWASLSDITNPLRRHSFYAEGAFTKGSAPSCQSRSEGSLWGGKYVNRGEQFTKRALANGKWRVCLPNASLSPSGGGFGWTTLSAFSNMEALIQAAAAQSQGKRMAIGKGVGYGQNVRQCRIRPTPYISHCRFKRFWFTVVVP